MAAIELIWDRKNNTKMLPAACALAAILALALLYLFSVISHPPTGEYIVQAKDVETAVAMVEFVGGRVTHKLGVINAVGAELTEKQLSQLGSVDVPLRIYTNSAAQVQAQDGLPAGDSEAP
jgi:hypothetical protein